MKIRPRLHPYLQGVDPTCFRNCVNYCILFVTDPPALALCILGCRVVCSD